MSDELVIKSTVDISMVFLDKELYEQIGRAAQMLAKSSMVPQNYRNNVGDCFVALEMASRLGVSPLMVMQTLYVVQGKPSWSGQAATAMLKNSPKYKNVRHVYFGEKGKDSWGCKVEATRTDTGELVTGAEVTIAIAKAEGWYSKSGSKWQTIPELMLAYRASAWFSRVHEPGLLMGMQTSEEVEDVVGISPEAEIQREANQQEIDIKVEPSYTVDEPKEEQPQEQTTKDLLGAEIEDF